MSERTARGAEHTQQPNPSSHVDAEDPHQQGGHRRAPSWVSDKGMSLDEKVTRMWAEFADERGAPGVAADLRASVEHDVPWGESVKRAWNTPLQAKHVGYFAIGAMIAMGVIALVDGLILDEGSRMLFFKNKDGSVTEATPDNVREITSARRPRAA